MSHVRWAVALALAASACVAPLSTSPRQGASAQGSSTPATPPRPRETVRRASGDVLVRLANFNGERKLSVRDAAGTTLQLERKGKQVLVDGVAREEVELSGRGPWKIGERTYPGALLVRAQRDGEGLELTNRLDLEQYVAGVVASEVALWSSELETLRAQAVAARSYAVAALDERGQRRADPYLVSDTRDMAYSGRFTPKNAREKALEKALALALESTRGKVLVEDKRVVDARFHAACGGATANASDVFPEAPFECLRSVPCPACRGELGLPSEAASDTWSFTATRSSLDSLATRFRVGTRVTGLAPVREDSAGRWLEVELTGNSGAARVRFEEVRRALGADKLPSSRIDGTWPRAGAEIPGGLRFDGRGRGHGVGLCQRAARDCAKAGWPAEKILAHFYPGAKLVDWR